MTATPITRILLREELPRFLEGKVEIGTEVGWGYRFLGLRDDKVPQVVVGALRGDRIDLFYHYNNLENQVYHCEINSQHPEYERFRQILAAAKQ